VEQNPNAPSPTITHETALAAAPPPYVLSWARYPSYLPRPFATAANNAKRGCRLYCFDYQVLHFVVVTFILLLHSNCASVVASFTMLQYDNSAFYFFALSFITIYLVPCK
jgi:hypothetical protein